MKTVRKIAPYKLKHKHINVNLKNEDGRTALKDAGRHKQLVNLLSEYVAK